jgi:hypothetical protein
VRRPQQVPAACQQVRPSMASCPRPSPDERTSDHPACSTRTAATPIRRAIDSQPVRLDTGNSRPPRRSDDGQKILEAYCASLSMDSDLVFFVELRGFEPRTSCMPCGFDKSI